MIIASGPVLIEKKEGKPHILLNKHGSDSFWKFPGGQIKRGETFGECAIRRAKEEMGLDVQLQKPIKPMIIWNDEPTILIHYLATSKGQVEPAPCIKDWGWFPLSKLPEDLGPNIKPVLEEIVK